MKKTLLFVILFNIVTFNQEQQPPPVFPKIGWGDLYFLKLHPYYTSTSNIDYSAQKYYYPELAELGLTHAVTAANENVSMKDEYNTSIKILDFNFAWIGDGDPNYLAYPYAWGQGNDPDHFVYEIGGGQFAEIKKGGLDNYGYGGFISGNNNKATYWVNNLATIGESNYNSLVGNSNDDDPIFGSKVISGRISSHDEGHILIGAFPPKQQANHFHATVHSYEYKINLIARINNTEENKNVMKISVREVNSPDEKIHPFYDESAISSPPATERVIFEQTFTENDFNGSNYSTIITNSFTMPGTHNSLLLVKIWWYDEVDIFIDKMYIYDDKYYGLFLSDASTQDQLVNTIEDNFDTRFDNIINHSLFENFYLDEPWHNSYRALKKVSAIAESLWGEKYFIATSDDRAKWQLDFTNDQFGYSKIKYFTQFRYKIGVKADSTAIATTSNNYGIQQVYDSLINQNIHTGHSDYFHGYRPSIEFANNYTPTDPNDDINYYQFIQVQAELAMKDGEVIGVTYRMPTPNEIITQGNLAICYGAKGIGYYIIHTNTLAPSSTSSKTSYYGLFDDESSIYTGGFNTNDPGVFQDPRNKQVPNSRYHAVKKLNEHIDKIGNELLELTWIDAFSLHKDNIESDYIEGITSYYTTDPPSNCEYMSIYCPDYPSETFVELGIFKKTNQIFDPNLEYFYLVNRRSLSTESRLIKIEIDKSNSNPNNYQNWVITEVGTNNFWYIGPTGYFQTFYEPGEGKLFRLEPVVFAGGTLAQNETIPVGAVIPVASNLTIPGSVTLTVQNGATLYIGNSNSLFVQGSLVVNGTSSSKVTFDFVTPNSSYSNGIRVNGGNLNINNAIIKNCYNGIKNYNSPMGNLKVTNSRFENYNGAAMFITYLTSTANITGNTFVGNGTGKWGIYLAYGAMANINNNIFQNSKVAIHLSQISNGYIVNNSITTNNLNNPGVYIQSGGGIIRNNQISGGFSAGISLANSNVKIGKNTIHNNKFYGIYVGSGSYPDLGPTYVSACDGTWIYSLSGGNVIYNNGGLTNEPFDDGSEIFLNYANIKLKNGCNSIFDDREPHEVYNNQILVGGFPLSTEQIYQFENNYWGDNRNFNGNDPNGRFGEFSVEYEPYLYNHCNTTIQECAIIVYDTEENPIDTVYAFEEFTGDLNEIEELFSEAEGYLNFGNYQQAIQIYEQVIMTDTSNHIKYEALSKLYNIYRYLGADSTAYTSLKNFYETYFNQVQDTVLYKMVRNLALLFLIEEGKYESAIDEFVNIIENYSGTEEALHAELDALTTSMIAAFEFTQIGKISSINNLMVNNVDDYQEKIISLLKLDNNSESVITTENLIPEVYSLSQNYPNPFNPITTIQYQIPLDGKVSLKVYDILGREVKTLVNEFKKAGYYKVEFNASQLTSGVYIYKIKSGDFVSVKKMLLLK